VITSHTRGFTLIEMIVLLVVVAVSATTLFGVFMKSSASSAHPLLREQAVAIAQGYLEEALLKAFQDPDQAETGTCEELNRSDYDDVPDYNCVNDTSGARDLFGATLAGLEPYNVSVTVTDVNLGSGANLAPARRVQVTVTHDAVGDLILQLVGHRALIN
jgi:MSHA pilin protein MshD